MHTCIMYTSVRVVAHTHASNVHGRATRGIAQVHAGAPLEHRTHGGRVEAVRHEEERGAARVGSGAGVDRAAKLVQYA